MFSTQTFFPRKPYPDVAVHCLSKSFYLEASMNKNTTESVMNVWNITNEAEKRVIMRQFLEKHGDFYTQDDFVKFLSKKYQVPASVHSLPVTGRRQEH
jgi:hypothetical protein